MNIKYLNQFVRKWKWEMFVLTVSAIFVFANISGYPSFFDDEGIYVSQALSFLRTGSLAQYTYWYDHAPVGWMMLGAFLSILNITGPIGSALVVSRIGMGFVHIINTLLVIYLGSRSSGKRNVGIVAGLFFSISPLVVVLSRMVFLDNIMVLLVLTAMFVLTKRRSLGWIVIAGILYALGVLVKESAMFFLIGFLIEIWKATEKKQRVFGYATFLLTTGIVGLFYPLYAALKGELLPSSDGSRVSLVSALKWQASRKGGFFLSDSSQFMFTLKHSWIPTDAAILAIGSMGLILMLASKKRSSYFGFLTFTFGYIFYLVRGGIINDQYFIPLAPFLSISSGFMLICGGEFILERFGKILKWISTGIVVGGLIFFYANKMEMLFVNTTSSQFEAIEWIKNKLPKDTRMAVDGYTLSEVTPIDGTDIYKFKGPQHYWKIDRDPTIKQQVFSNSWKRIDYMMENNKMVQDAKGDNLDFLLTALKNSDVIDTFTPVKSWYDGYHFYGYLWGHLLLADPGSTSIKKLKTPEYLAMAETWEGYKSRFIKEYGKVVDPQSGNTTSEGQAYAMLRAVWMNDKTTFDGVMSWTADHMQHRQGDKLISWLWTSENKLGDFNNAADADLDYITALIFASRTWNDKTYLEKAKVMMKDLWEKNVVQIDGRYYLYGGSGSKTVGGYVLNPSYFSPAYYKIFATIDSIKPWNLLVRDTYWLLGRIQGLPPNWIWVNEYTGELLSAKDYTNSRDSEEYGFDSFRTFYRVALDASWFDSTDAISYLKKSQPFMSREWKSKSGFKAIYTRQGKSTVDYSSMATLAGPLSVLSTTDLPIADEVYQKLVESRLDSGGWGDTDNYYDQNWVWFAVGLYADKLPNLAK